MQHHIEIFITAQGEDGAFAEMVRDAARQHSAIVTLSLGHDAPAVRQQQIARAHLVIVVLSPVAVESLGVQFDFVQAIDLRRPIVSLVHQPCNTPMRLRLFPIIDATSDPQNAIVQLLTLIDNTPLQEPSPIPAGTVVTLPTNSPSRRGLWMSASISVLLVIAFLVVFVLNRQPQRTASTVTKSVTFAATAPVSTNTTATATTQPGPASNSWKTFPVSFNDSNGGSDAQNIAVAGDGTVWFSEAQSRILTHLDAAGQVVPASKPLTFSPRTLMRASDGTIWFEEATSFIGHIAKNGTISEIPMLITGANGLSQSAETFTTDTDGTLWLAAETTIVHYDPATGQKVVIPVTLPPNPSLNYILFQQIAVDANHQVWFLDDLDDVIGIVNPITRQTRYINIKQQYPTIGDISVTGVVFADARGTIWFTTGSSIVHISANDTITPYPNSTGTISSFAQGTDGTLWFGTWEGSIGHIAPDGSVPTIPVAASRVYTLAAAPDGSIWATLIDDNVIGQFVP